VTDAPALALSITGLTKSYGGNHALDGVNLEVRPGEVHALLGQNGCGKSTLVKCLTGVVKPDAGAVSVYGSPIGFPVGDPHHLGIAVVHQDIGLVDSMTVLENLGISARYGAPALAPVNERSERAIYRALMDKLDVSFDLDASVSTLSPAQRALLGFLRAYRLLDGTTANQLFILDEPTAALPRPEAQHILRLTRRVADLGSAVIFISHRLQEVMEACDRATVMRSGKDVAHLDIAATSRAEIVAHMLGRRMDEFFPAPAPVTTDARVVFAAEGITGRVATDVSFGVRAGEVVGVTGLAGMGQEEMPFLLSGGELPASGDVLLDDVAHRWSTPAEAITAGVALVPGHRLRDGVWIAGTAEENITLPVLPGARAWYGLRGPQLRQLAHRLMTGVGVHPNDPALPMAAFSGGNQQKVVFAKWTQLAPRVLLLDEPTQGVDPGSAKDLLTQALDLAAQGTGVLVFSGDYEQLAAICHRVIVLHEGRVSTVLAGEALTEEGLLHACEVPAA
jgi:ribose transport system ATP-binding protein